uniref:MJ0670 protein n=1 Tax=Fopius arisanus TaxID=64838 RepID=A0A0C9RN43_9HYME
MLTLCLRVSSADFSSPPCPPRPPHLPTFDRLFNQAESCPHLTQHNPLTRILLTRLTTATHHVFSTLFSLITRHFVTSEAGKVLAESETRDYRDMMGKGQGGTTPSHVGPETRPHRVNEQSQTTIIELDYRTNSDNMKDTIVHEDGLRREQTRDCIFSLRNNDERVKRLRTICDNC